MRNMSQVFEIRANEEDEEYKKLCKACYVKVYKGSDNLLGSAQDCKKSLSSYYQKEVARYHSSGRVSARDELFPQDGPCRNSSSPLGHSVQHTREERPSVVDSSVQEHMGDLRKSYQEVLQGQEEPPLDFENNDRIWYPPPPKDGIESSDFQYEEEDSDIEHSASEFSLSRKELLTTVVNDQLRAIVAELLHGYNSDWLDIVTTLARDAANFIKPDTTSTGSSMDPGQYVKIKCVASGNRNESILIKGIVCSKKIHCNGTFSRKENPKFLLVAESLEHQIVPSQLASFDKVLQQEKDYTRTIMAQTESQLPNLLLVGQCELFRTEEVKEQQYAGSPQRKLPRTLMYFEGCPRRLGCTVLLRGSCHEELKKIKRVVQYAVFAAYHLALETSFLVDEGASLPIMPSSCALNEDMLDKLATRSHSSNQLKGLQESTVPSSSREVPESQTQLFGEEETHDSHQSILVFFSSRCVYGVPPASPRVVMSDTASRLSFGKFLELSFSNRETANRVASCGHSLQRDCLQFFGFGSMAVFFRYSPINILTVHLPPPVLEFNSYRQLEWICKEAKELNVSMQTLHEEIDAMLTSLESKVDSLDPQKYDVKDLKRRIMDLNDQFRKEKVEYTDGLQPFLLFQLKSRLANEAALKIPDDENVHSNLEAIPDNKDLQKSEKFSETGNISSLSSLPLRPLRVHSLDSGSGVQEGTQKDLLSFRSFRESNVMRNYSPMLPLEVSELNLVVSSKPKCISSASHMAGEAIMLIPQLNLVDIVIPVYGDDPGSAVSYALSSKEYKDWVVSRSNSTGPVDVDNIHQAVQKESQHFTISFNGNLSASGCNVKILVTCYNAMQFDTLRKQCCPNEVEFVRSLSRCKKWDAQGGKSKVYFAKSLDERFIMKEVIDKEMESFKKFGFEYFKYLAESYSSGNPTCIAKILGIYQVSVKIPKGGKEMKKNLMVLENLFYNRTISRIYDLKGSKRARYIADTSGANNVLLDENLVEGEPIFVGSKAKRSLEKAIGNDTTFLSTVDIMDYSLLVGLDEERKELVPGIIDYVRGYTWDKRLETMVKSPGLLGGRSNESPTVISPKKYKTSTSGRKPTKERP
ncbi:hypothetical protein AALP_AA1G251400 [Arabis alpina]|uniref:PIPK domain-containing protein n=1 Tax=Arabis alpina TaxID=50452 RepID=A0A087HQI9_ARAAL|nr:hypothetical protein AALP_AA1G251400 [Arabis alpina]